MGCVPCADIFNDGYTGKHEVQPCSLIDYGINCFNVFPFDYIHLAFLGAVERSILFWKEDPRGPYRLSVALSSQKFQTSWGKNFVCPLKTESAAYD